MSEKLDKNQKLVIRDLRMEYLVREGTIKAVNGVNLAIPEGMITAIVGESGSGKTSLVETFLKILPKNARIRSGKALLKLSNGTVVDLIEASDSLIRKLRGKVVGYVPQGAQNSLNPVLTIEQHFLETLREHGIRSKEAIEERVCAMLSLVRLDPEVVLKKYPHELSGGMKQRVVIALTMLLQPELVVLDEPTSALDIFSQRVLLNILYKIQSTYKNTMVLITHDIPIVSELSDRVAVLYAGAIVESADTYEIFKEPLHPYTSMLISAIPSVVDVYLKRVPKPVPGELPSLLNPPPGCRFHPRCPHAFEKCRLKEPPTVEVRSGHSVSCWLYTEGV
ncbi:MAG: ABC transporter ATP-binding protein [Sulfolobales archaeon]